MTAMLSSDTSSEDEIDRLKEAVDSRFFKDELFSQKTCSTEIPTPKVKLLPSLRNSTSVENTFNPLAIKVTPEYQKFVSKKLTKILDELIDDSKELKVPNKLRKSDEVGGVKLLHTSKYFMEVDKSVNDLTVTRRWKKRTRKFHDYVEADTSEEERRAREVAVSPEWVLSQKETKHWAPCMKGEMEIIKLEKSEHLKLNGSTTVKINKKKNRKKKKLYCS